MDTSVLVTGASGGIGRATAEMFVSLGWRVFGTSRKPDASGPDGVTMLALDVTDDGSVAAFAAKLTELTDGLDLLVNNAGSGVAGPLENTTAAELAAQLDVNLVGSHRVTRAVLPLIKKRRGRIVFISSVAGFVPIPFQSCYSMSKYAVEAMAECLRIELAPAGVAVTLVEPGDTKTGFTAGRTRTAVSAEYVERFERSLARMEHDETNGMPPSAVAACVRRAATAKRPPVRITVGGVYKLLRFIKRLLPDRLASFVIAKLYG